MYNWKAALGYIGATQGCQWSYTGIPERCLTSVSSQTYLKPLNSSNDKCSPTSQISIWVLTFACPLPGFTPLQPKHSWAGSFMSAQPVVFLICIWSTRGTNWFDGWEVSKLDHMACLVSACVCKCKQKYAGIFLPLEFFQGSHYRVCFCRAYNNGEAVKINPWGLKLAARARLYKGSYVN